MKRAPLVALTLLISTAAFSAPQTSRKTSRRNTTAAQLQEMSAQLQELKNMVVQQQQRIDNLTQQLQQREASLSEVRTTATDAANTATSAQRLATQNSTQYGTLNNQVAALSSSVNATSATVQTSEKKLQEAVESPVALHYKGVTITPGGFLAAESVYHSRGLLADVNTPFNTIPFSGSGQSRLSDWYGSGRQSRITLLVEGKVKSATLRGYFETDWLSAGTTSNNNLTNSYTNRQRQLFAQVAFNNGITITGGQMWSLLAETKKGTDNRTEATPLTIDPMFSVGFTWARQFGFRVQKNFANRAWLAFAVENAQTLLSASGSTANFVVGGPGNGAGLYNPTANYSLNYTPDFIAKAAFEPGFGHYEVFGVVRNFRDRIYPNAGGTTPSAAGASNDTLTGGGIGANARVTVAKKVDLGLHAFGGNGVGRYGSGNLTDVTVRPDGSLVLLRSLQALATFEVHTRKWDWYFNGGGEFVGHSWTLNASGKPVGYGSPLFDNSGCATETVPTAGTGFAPGNPSKCVGQTRNLLEGIAGFWYKPYSGPKGRIQFGPQYSYVVRNTWAGAGGQPHSIENMVFTSFRYYIP